MNYIERNNRIVERREAGLTQKAIADIYGISVTRVAQVIARAERASAIRRRNLRAGMTCNERDEDTRGNILAKAIKQEIKGLGDYTLKNIPDETRLDWSILPVRSTNWLRREVNTLGELKAAPDIQLLRIPGIGIKTLAYIRAIYGYTGDTARVPHWAKGCH